ncbi:carbohydrate binding domain-containing protein [bacterium]|nr:carbohydrate binding domain-containing protein [bacterium]
MLKFEYCRNKKINCLMLFVLSAGFGLNASLLPPAILNIHPRPDSKFHSVRTNIILNLKKDYLKMLDDVSSLIHVKSGGLDYQGEAFFATDGKTIIFDPNLIFPQNAAITVTVALSQLNDEDDLQYTFYTVSSQTQLPKKTAADDTMNIQTTHSLELNEDVRLINNVAVPSDFPYITTRQPGKPEPGMIFYATNYPSTSGNYLIICKNDGTPYYFRKIDDVVRSGNFLLHPNGWLSAHLYDQRGRTYWRHLIFDSMFTLIDVYQVGHGYNTDNHELQFLANGHALMIAHQVVQLDLSNIIPDGQSNVAVQGMHFQELDKDKNVIFEWRSWDHFNIQDAVKENLWSSNIDYVHLNSVAIDYDSNYVISSRNLSEVTKIDRETGEIIWRLGGVNNQFDHINDDIMISYQHDARPVRGKPNHYLIFDNGWWRSPHFSRAVEYLLDTSDMTAEVVWQYRYIPDRAVSGMGSSQRLPGGNTLIDWPQNRTQICEVTPDGNIVFELFSSGHSNYRCRRFDWHGQMRVPYLQIENHSAFIRLFFNKFGDESVQYYNIYAGKSDNPDNLVTSTTQTYCDITNLENRTMYYFRVTAVDDDQLESGFSQTESTYVKYVGSGKNEVKNGSFDSPYYWNLETDPAAKASANITGDREYQIHITNGGEDISDVQLYQSGILLVQGKDYVFEFDAYASSGRQIHAKVTRGASPYTNYGKIGGTYVTTRKQHFQYPFVMEDPADTDARVVFECGTSTGDLYIDNVSLVYHDSETADSVIRLNFQPAGVIPPEGYLADTGTAYSLQENGYFYGWLNGVNGETRLRDTHEDLRYATLNHMQKVNPRSWEIQVANGEYRIHLVMGDPSHTDQTNHVMIEETIINDPDGEDYFDEYSVIVEVNDGKLSLSPASTSENAKLCFIEIESLETSVKNHGFAIPRLFLLKQNYPNPFNPKTTIQYTVYREMPVDLSVYNINGQRVATLVHSVKQPGNYSATFDGAELASGVYYYRFKSNNEIATRRMVLMK